MINEAQAKALVLNRCDTFSQDGERFAVQSCTLSPKGDYWIIRANSEDFVLRGIQERCYVGVNAHLVDTASGCIETVGSAQSVEQYLEDKYDLTEAGDKHYVLEPSFGRDDKATTILLRQKLDCSVQRAIELLSPASRRWLTGKKSTLRKAQSLLAQEGISTSIQLQVAPGSALNIDDSVWYWEELKALLNRHGIK